MEHLKYINHLNTLLVQIWNGIQNIRCSDGISNLDVSGAILDSTIWARPEFKWLKIKIQNGFQKIKPFEYQTRKSPVSGDWVSDFRLALVKINNFKFNCIEITINNA